VAHKRAFPSTTIAGFAGSAEKKEEKKKKKEKKKRDRPANQNISLYLLWCFRSPVWPRRVRRRVQRNLFSSYRVGVPTTHCKVQYTDSRRTAKTPCRMQRVAIGISYQTYLIDIARAIPLSPTATLILPFRQSVSLMCRDSVRRKGGKRNYPPVADKNTTRRCIIETISYAIVVSPTNRAPQWTPYLHRSLAVFAVFHCRVMSVKCTVAATLSF